MNTTAAPVRPNGRSRSLLKQICRNYALYLLILPSLLYLFVFSYMPMYGVQIAFRDFKPVFGIVGSDWTGIKHFQRFFESSQCLRLLTNTLTLSLYQIVAGFPVPILLALVIHYTTLKRFKRIGQTITYAPYFISVVVMAGMVILFLSPTSGFINIGLQRLGAKPAVYMQQPEMFKHIYVWSGVWQSMGWGSIIYIAALSGVSPELHEAAIVDGATKLQRVFHVDIPIIIPTAVILLIMNMGHVMSVGFEKVYLLQNDANLNTSEIISTYVYKIGIRQSAQYSYSTSIGLFNNAVNLVILLGVNKLTGSMSGISLF